MIGSDRPASKEVSFTGQSGMAWRYWADRPLGKPGGFGGVYAAEGPDAAHMAVKVVNKQRPSGMLVDDRLLRREIDIGRRVHESGSDMLLPVIDAADVGDALLLVMARAGEPLSVVLPMGEADAIAAMTGIATGLQDLHAIGIIHRDLKPPNVLSHDGHWKLADFGIARDQEIGTQDVTFAGWGSAPYMAPELWEQKSPTVKTDLYAFGCLAFELLTGAPPYAGDLAALREAHLAQAPPDVPCSNVIIKNLIARLIAKDPAERPQDARAVLERLRRAAIPYSAVQEAIARELDVHRVEKSQTAARAAAVEAAENLRRQQVSQGMADLREIMSDALEGLQAVETNATMQELKSGREPREFILSTADAMLRIEIWSHSPDQIAPGDTMLLAGAAIITNRRHTNDRTTANVVYENNADRFAWQVYKFRSRAFDMDDDYNISFPDPQGLNRDNFLHQGKASSPHNRVTLTADTVLELFREAANLRP